MRLEERTSEQRLNTANLIALAAAWLAGHTIEWLTIEDSYGKDTWTSCPMSPEYWDFNTFEYRLKKEN